MENYSHKDKTLLTVLKSKALTPPSDTFLIIVFLLTYSVLPLQINLNIILSIVEHILEST